MKTILWYLKGIANHGLLWDKNIHCFEWILTLIMLTIKIIASLTHDTCSFLHMLPLHGAANTKQTQQTSLLNLSLLLQMKQSKRLFGLDNYFLVVELARTSQPCSILIIKVQFN